MGGKLKGIALSKIIKPGAPPPGEPFFNAAGEVEVPMQGRIFCPHCKRDFFGLLRHFMSPREAYDLAGRIIERIRTAQGMEKARGAMDDRRRWKDLTQ